MATTTPDTATPDTIVLRDDTALELELEIAGVGSRSYAFVIDWHIRLIATLVWGAFFWLLSDLGVTVAMGSTATLVLGFGPALLMYLLYHPILETGWNGWTPGKRMAGVKIVGADGRPVAAGAHLLRNVFRILDSMPMLYALGLSFALFHPRQLRIGDIAAGTVLVFEPKHQGGTLAEAQASVQSQRLSTAQHELALDLIARWDGLERARRIALAERFLVSLGESLPEHGGIPNREDAMLERLRALTRAGS
jgi:uncharacterized RDD family membrane protein YckC